MSYILILEIYKIGEQATGADDHESQIENDFTAFHLKAK
jgi:hypothetical protein